MTHRTLDLVYTRRYPRAMHPRQRIATAAAEWASYAAVIAFFVLVGLALAKLGV